MSILGGSPLGLIGVRTTPTRDGMSTFNGGRSRNINVNFYNSGIESDKEKMDKTRYNKSGGMFSVFTGGSVIKPWGNIGNVGKETTDLGLGADYKRLNRRTLHNNDVYDTSILNIIEKTANTAAALRPSDFAYLKNLGVYPNNRLVIARRFAGPVHDDIFAKNSTPLAVMITWRPESEDFLEISFGEFWVDANADFKDVLTNVTKDILGKSAGSTLAAGAGAIPLPGFTEVIQRTVMQKFGILDESADVESPVGNPNIIKEAKRRKTLGYGEAGSGLMCKVSIKMVVEYEQKFISGIDPTIVYQDILANAVRFGTSPKKSYGLSNGAAKEIIGFVNSPKTFVSKIATAIGSAISDAKDEILDIFKAKDEKKDEKKEPLGNIAEGLLNKIIKTIGSALEGTIRKYRMEVEGIVRALALLPSTPWHVTIGNPLRPIFCSGDMLGDSFTLKLGPTLAFNDLPSNITLDFTLTNARNWGADEIMAKFNSGYLRTVNLRKDTNNTLENINQYSLSEDNKITKNNANVPVSNLSSNVSSQTNSTTPAQTTTTENQSQSTINPDPNATTGAVTT